MATRCCSPPESWAGKFVHTLLQAHLLQNVSAAAQRVTADLRGKLDIFQRGQVLHQIIKLEDKADVVPAVLGELALVVGGNFLAVQPDQALAERIHPAQDVEDGGFARAGRADNDAELSFFHSEVDIAQSVDFDFAHSIDFFNVMEFDKRHLSFPPNSLFLSVLSIIALRAGGEQHKICELHSPKFLRDGGPCTHRCEEG